jgi:eukaryotic-like serine/threonine-protein kinase
MTTNISTNQKRDLYTHIAIIICGLVVLFLGFFFVYLPWITNHGEAISVPDLKGKTIDEIEEILDDRGLRYEVADSVFKLGVPPLTVVSQYPAYGAKVKGGRKIYITVITETAPMVKLPQLTDMSLKSAEMQLVSAGLMKGSLKYINDPREGVVIGIEQAGKKIEAGTLIAKGTKIDLVLGDGLGDTEISIPDVVGKTLDEAELIIKGSDLNIGLKQYEPDNTDFPAGTVVRQNPSNEDGKIRPGQMIDLWIAGPPPN